MSETEAREVLGKMVRFNKGHPWEGEQGPVKEVEYVGFLETWGVHVELTLPAIHMAGATKLSDFTVVNDD